MQTMDNVIDRADAERWLGQCLEAVGMEKWLVHENSLIREDPPTHPQQTKKVL